MMQKLIESINSSSRIERKLDEKTTKVLRTVAEHDPLYTGFTTVTVDIAEPDLKTFDYKNPRRFQRIRTYDDTQSLCDWYEIKVKK